MEEFADRSNKIIIHKEFCEDLTNKITQTRNHLTALLYETDRREKNKEFHKHNNAFKKLLSEEQQFFCNKLNQYTDLYLTFNHVNK